MSCLHNVTTKEILNKHRERCLLINYTQAVETGVIKFKNYGKKIPMTFRIYADIERFLKRINIDEGKYTKLYQKHTPNSTGEKLYVLMIDLRQILLFSKVKIVLINLLNGFPGCRNIVIK